MTRLSSFLLLLFVLCFPFISFAYSLVAFVSFRFGYNVSSVAYNIITFSLKVLFLFYFYDTRSNMIFMAFFSSSSSFYVDMCAVHLRYMRWHCIWFVCLVLRLRVFLKRKKHT